MKNKIMQLFIALMLILLVGCGILQNGDPTETPDPTSTSTPTPTQESVNDYFPIKENVKYIYEGKGNEYAAYDVYVDYKAQNKVQLRKNNGGTVLAEVIEVSQNKVTRIFSKEEVYYKENYLDKVGEKEEILLMGPIKTGTKWSLDEKRERSITDIAAEVATPYGSFQAIEVTTVSDTGNTMNYYAKDIGLVKSVFVSDNTEVTSSLSKVEENAAFETELAFFYPSGMDNNIYYKNKKLSFKTNEDANQIIETAYKQDIGEGTAQVLTSNAKINKLSLDENGIVNIDLNHAFISEMNAGAMYEGVILQSLINTVCQFYNSDTVSITVDREPYESGHIIIKAGEYLHPDYHDVIEVK